MNRSLFKRYLSKIGCYAVTVALIIFFLFPIYYIVTMAFKVDVDAMAYPPKWIFTPTLKNFVEIFQDGALIKSLINSVIVSSACVLVGLAAGTPAAYALSRLKCRWVSSVMFFILAARLIPPMSMLLPIFSLFVKLNLIDTHLGLILLNLTFVLPLNVWMQKSFFDEVPREMEEAAEIDGCTVIQAFVLVVLPLIAQALVATAIFSWIQAWNEYLFALTVTRSNARTIIVAVNNYINFEQMQWGKTAATSVIISLPVMVFSFFVRKHLISGLSAGGVKA